MAAAVCLLAAVAQSSKADQSTINAHAWTKPNSSTTSYFWIRCINDSNWGISGFMYINSGKSTYYVQPTQIVWPTSGHVILTSPIQFGTKKTPAILTTDLWVTDTVNYASYFVTSAANPGLVLDSSVPNKTTSGYIKLAVPKTQLMAPGKL